MKYFLGTVSLLALISSQAFATKQLDKALLLADDESSQTALIKKLMKSHDYTFDLNADALSDGIAEAVKKLNKSGADGFEKEKPVDPSTIKFEAKRRIANNLDSAKTSRAPLGNGYYLTKNFRGDALSVESKYSPLVYPVKSSDRDRPDGFLPLSYTSNFMSARLCREIDDYASHNGLSEEDAQRLNRYLQPIFYIVQKEASQMLEGSKSLLHTKRWVYGKDYSDVVKSVKAQTSHHHALIKYAGLKGFNASVVEDSLVPSLVDLALSLIPNPSREIYRSGGNIYTLGLNHNGHLSLIHPSIEDLPYPVFSEHRGRGNMNLPKGFEDSPALRKQWDRVGEFVRLNEEVSSGEKTRSIILLEPVGYLFNKYLKNFHVSRSDYPEQRRAEDEIIDLARFFSDTHHIPMPFLDMFYQGRVNIHKVLGDIRYKSDYHLALTEDLWPQRLSNQKDRLTNDLLNYLVFKDIQDRFKEFYQYAGSRLDRLQTALN